MSEPIDKASLTRLSWITELRRQGHRQCHGSGAAAGGKVCAMELLREMLGLQDLASYEAVGVHAGIGSHVHKIINMNDGRLGHRKHTFAEIADVVEGWFK